MMNKYARIEAGQVAELLQTAEDTATMFHPDLVWVDITSVVPAPAVGWAYEAGAFVEPVIVVPTLAEIKSAKLAELAVDFTLRMGKVKAGYPDDEIQSWFDQKFEAVAFTANSSDATPLLSVMASARNITVADLAARVIANSQVYSAAAGSLIGKRQKYEDIVNAAVDETAGGSVIWID